MFFFIYPKFRSAASGSPEVETVKTVKRLKTACPATPTPPPSLPSLPLAAKPLPRVAPSRRTSRIVLEKSAEKAARDARGAIFERFPDEIKLIFDVFQAYCAPASRLAA